MTKVSETTSNHLPSASDISTLISALHEMTRALRSYSQGVAQGQPQQQQHLDAVPNSPPPAGTTPDSGLQEPTETTKSPASDTDGSILVSQRATVYSTPTSQKKAKQARREALRNLHREFCLDGPAHITAFADKAIAQIFEKSYATGLFHDEIRYYHVPAHIVEFEHKLLARHQQKDIPDLLFSVHNELNLRSKLIACLDKDEDRPDFSPTRLAESILQHLKLLHTIHEHLNSFKLINKTMLPWRHNQSQGELGCGQLADK